MMSRRWKPWMIASLAGVACLSAAVLADVASWNDKVDDFQDEKLEFRLQWHEMEIDCDVDFQQPKRSDYKIELKGAIRRPFEIDAVGVCEYVKVVKVLDADGENMLETSKKYEPHKTVDYNAFHDRVAAIELKDMYVTANPYTIDKIVAEARIIVGEERKTQRLAAVVMEKPEKVHNDVRLRIRMLKMSEKQVLTLVADYERRKEGTDGPFVEAIYAIDKEGNRIGGGRWVKGTPFGDKGKITYEFQVQKDQTHAEFEFVVCEKHRAHIARFEISDVFGK